MRSIVVSRLTRKSMTMRTFCFWSRHHWASGQLQYLKKTTVSEQLRDVGRDQRESFLITYLSGDERVHLQFLTE